jgi:UDP-N-acetylmuramoylalanine--D-glutamate ligase
LITNITPKHLDWHRDFLEYQNAKLGILENADGFVYDFDDPISRSLLSQSCAFAAVSSELSFEELKQLCRAEHYVTIAGRLIAIDGVPRISFADALRDERHNIKNFMLALALTDGKR